jgi:hypothetical protein
LDNKHKSSENKEEEFWNGLYYYLYKDVFDSDNITEDGSIQLNSERKREAYKLFQQLCEIKNIEVNYVKEFQNSLLFDHFGSVVLDDEQFWNMWKNSSEEVRSNVLLEAKKFLNNQGSIFNNLSKKEKWYKFRHHIKNLSDTFSKNT